MSNNAYVLVSACRNEQGYIRDLIDCIGAQTIRPLRWIIVDDGSTDGTHQVAKSCAEHLDFVQITKLKSDSSHSFTSQVFAAQHGYQLLNGLDYHYIGFLDADIRFSPDYYQRLLSCFASDPQLGLAGGSVLDRYGDKVLNTRRGSEHFHVAGGIQFFRRECFEQIGGYHPIDGGGQDTIADVMSMMKGWKVRVFPELEVLHLRPAGATRASVWQRGLRWGRKFYLLGYDPLFYFGQCVRRLPWKPFFIGAFCQMLGFVVAHCKRESRPVSPEFVRFQRRIQRRRMFGMLQVQSRS